MASLRKLKKEIDYLISEVISDGYTCLIVHPDKNRASVFNIIEEAVEVRNKLIDKANNPAEKKNPSLVKKHYQALRNEIFDSVDALFVKLSDSCKAEQK